MKWMLLRMGIWVSIIVIKLYKSRRLLHDNCNYLLQTSNSKVITNTLHMTKSSNDRKITIHMMSQRQVMFNNQQLSFINHICLLWHRSCLRLYYCLPHQPHHHLRYCLVHNKLKRKHTCYCHSKYITKINKQQDTHKKQHYQIKIAIITITNNKNNSNSKRVNNNDNKLIS